MRQFLEWLGARSGELTDAPITLATPGPGAAAAAPAARAPAPAEGRDDRVVFEGLLTRRELDVLRLLAEGKANKAIADELVISDGTVKFHVNSILRKLHAANRAEAVSTVPAAARDARTLVVVHPPPRTSSSAVGPPEEGARGAVEPAPLATTGCLDRSELGRGRWDYSRHSLQRCLGVDSAKRGQPPT